PRISTFGGKPGGSPPPLLCHTLFKSLPQSTVRRRLVPSGIILSSAVRLGGFRGDYSVRHGDGLWCARRRCWISSPGLATRTSREQDQALRPGITNLHARSGGLSGRLRAVF